MNIKDLVHFLLPFNVDVWIILPFELWNFDWWRLPLWELIAPSPTIMVVPSSSSPMAWIFGRRSPSSPFIFSKFKPLNVFLKEYLTLSSIRPQLVKSFPPTCRNRNRDGTTNQKRKRVWKEIWSRHHSYSGKLWKTMKIRQVCEKLDFGSRSRLRVEVLARYCARPRAIPLIKKCKVDVVFKMLFFSKKIIRQIILKETKIFF